MSMENRWLRADLERSRERFDEITRSMHPRIHRFCSRMTGSALDGEDLAQDTLAHAFYKLASLKDEGALETWIFRIAHRKCIDFLRRHREVLLDTAGEDDVPFEESNDCDVEVREQVGAAMTAVVTGLAPKERASVLLKDVLDCSLTEIAEIVDSTTGGVKAALHRGREKLARPAPPDAIRALPAETRHLVEAYVSRFNERDWDGVRALLRADARLELVGRVEVDLAGAGYFDNYGRIPWPWRLCLGRVDGEEVVVHMREHGGEWRAHAAIRLRFVNGKVAVVRDYVHVDHLFAEGAVARVAAE